MAEFCEVVTASSYSTYCYICKTVLRWLFTLAYWLPSHSNSFTRLPRPTAPTHSTVLWSAASDRHTDILPLSFHSWRIKARQRLQQTQGWEQRHRGVGPHRAGLAKAQDGYLREYHNSISTFDFDTTTTAICDTGTLLVISFKLCPPKRAARWKDPCPVKF